MIDKIKAIYVALFDEKKLPVLLKGNNSSKILIKAAVKIRLSLLILYLNPYKKIKADFNKIKKIKTKKQSPTSPVSVNTSR